MEIRKKKTQGFTLIEVMVVITIIILLILLALLLFRVQLSKARDARRKSDLAKFKQNLEDYYSDNGCYPTSFPKYLCKDDFGKYGLTPCDPLNNPQHNYYYQYAGDCKWFKVFTNLENQNDPDIASVGCVGGCNNGWSSYNWGVTSPNVGLEGCEEGWSSYGCQGSICNLIDTNMFKGGFTCKPANSCFGEDCCDNKCH